MLITIPAASPAAARSRWVSFLLGISLCAFVSELSSQTNLPPLAYYGSLSQSGEPASGTFDMKFTVFESAEGGLAMSALLRTNVVVDHGQFVVPLEFEPTVLARGGAWIEIATKPAESVDDFQSLQPRQPIPAVFFALFTPLAGEAAWSQSTRSAAPGAISSEAIAPHSITPGKIAPATVVRSINGLTDDVNLRAGANIKVERTPGGLRISAAMPEPDPVANTLWVDSVTGDDATAQRGIMNKPWLTLSNALAALADGDRLVIRPGVYQVSRLGMPTESGNYALEHDRVPLLLQGRSGVTIDAEGAVVAASGLGSVLSITDCTNMVIRGLRFIGPGANPVIPTQIGGEIVLWGTNVNLVFDRCQFEDFPNHGILVSQKEKTSFDTLVRDCVFRRGGTLRHEKLGPDGAAVASLGPGLKVIGCTFEDVVRGIEVEGSYNTRPIGPVLIANNVLRNFWSAGIIVIPGNYRHLNDIHISDNVLLGDNQVRPGAVYQIGVRAHGGSRISVVGNNIGRCATDGINLTALAPLVDALVANNVCWENGSRNIAVLNRFSQLRNVVVTGNLCTRIGEHPSITVSGENVSITDNTLNGGLGPAISAVIEPGFETSHVLITGNRFSGTDSNLVAIAAGVRRAVVRDNLATLPDPVILDGGTATEKDQAFLLSGRSYQPTVPQVLGAEDPVLPNARNIRVVGLEGPVRLQSTPSIPPAQDGHLLSILGTSDQESVTFQDNTVLPNSALGLSATERSLGRGDILTLRYDETDATWWEVSFSDKPEMPPP